MSFEVGEIVMLKSGGPRMTVSKVSDVGVATCDWFVGGARWSEPFKESNLKNLGCLGNTTPTEQNDMFGTTVIQPKL